MSINAVLADPGPLILPTDIDEALIGVLRAWMPTFLRITSDERSLPQTLPSPKFASYRSVLDQDEFMDRDLPGVLVTTSKTTGQPMRLPDGTYQAEWTTVVSFVVRGTVALETRQRAAQYEGAGRRCLGHRNCVAGAGGIVHCTRWMGVEITPVADVSRQGRYLAAGMSTFQVYTDAAFKDAAGPATPFVDPTQPPPLVSEGTVTEVDITDDSGPNPSTVTVDQSTQFLGG